MSETEGEFNWSTLVYEGDPAAAEEAQPAETVEQPPAETTQEERARNEKGQFVAKTETETPEEAAERLWAGKYKTPEAAEAAWIEAQQLVGLVRHEQGQLREQLEALQKQQAQPRNVQDFEQMLEENVEQAALYALTAGDTYAYERAKAHWEQLAPGAPKIWENNLRLQQQVAELEAKFTQIQQPVAEQQNLRVVADAYRDIQASNTDFADLQPFMGEIIDGIASDGYDWVTPALESGVKSQITSALNTVLLLARARASGNLKDQAIAAAQEHVAATEQAKREAIVGHATTSMSEPADKTTGQRVYDTFQQFDITAYKHDK